MIPGLDAFATETGQDQKPGPWAKGPAIVTWHIDRAAKMRRGKYSIIYNLNNTHYNGWDGRQAAQD